MKNKMILQKVWDIYRFIQENLYLNRPDMRIGEDSFNSTLLLGILTALS